MNLSYLIRGIFGLAFFQGVLSYIGIPSIQYQLLLEFLLLILLIVFIYLLPSREDKSLRIPGIIWFLLFTIAVFISSLINESTLFTTYRFYRHILWPYIFFLSILNINLSPSAIREINKFIVFLVVLQIPAAIYKYLIYGVHEGTLIGTFDTQAGTMSAIFPLFITCYVISFYLFYKKKLLYLLLIPGMIFFAWGGGKRAFFVLMPLLFVITYFIYNQAIKSRINIFALGLIILFSIIVLYIGGRYHPKFNPEGEFGGSFDIAYIITQISDYETGYSTSHYATTGRFSTTVNVLDQITKWNIVNIIFGDGPHQLYLEDDQSQRYQIYYGVTGLTFNLISVGVLGTVSLFLLYFSLGTKTYYFVNNSQEPFHKAIAFGTTLATIVFCFDFLLYSRSYVTQYIPSIVFFYLTALALKQNKQITPS